MAHRCHICDRSDDRSVVSTTDQLFHGQYLKDVRYPELELCSECVEAINEIIYEDEEDDPILPFN